MLNKAFKYPFTMGHSISFDGFRLFCSRPICHLSLAPLEARAMQICKLIFILTLLAIIAIGKGIHFALSLAGLSIGVGVAASFLIIAWHLWKMRCLSR